MADGTKVLAIYDDAPVFGGHEQMSCQGIEALLQESDPRLVCFYARENEKLRDRLRLLQAESATLELVELPFSSRRFQGIRSRFEHGRIQWIAEQLKQVHAAALLVLQGDIELSSLGVLAGNRIGIPTVSYIPVPHTLQTMGAKLGRWRDPFNSWLFDRPDAYITISEGMKSLLQERGATAEISVVLNSFDPAKTAERDQGEARRALGLPAEKKLVGMVGRVEYKQKGQDFLLEVFAQYRSRFSNVGLVYVGGGPDAAKLAARVQEEGLEGDVTLIAWTDGLADVYGALDVLALPSQFEGVPLVMLEAMSVGLPIVATARDGMKEFLPPQWLFPVGDREKCAAVLETVLENPPRDLIEENRQRVKRDFSVERFNSAFVAATRSLGKL